MTPAVTLAAVADIVVFPVVVDVRFTEMAKVALVPEIEAVPLIRKDTRRTVVFLEGEVDDDTTDNATFVSWKS